MLLPCLKTFLVLSMAFLLISCGEKTNNQNNDALKEEIANRELKKVSDAEIIATAYYYGNLMADTSQFLYFNSLQTQLKENGIGEALKFYNIKGNPVTDSLSSEFDATIRRVSDKPRNNENAPNELESLLLDSYLYNIENDLPLEENVQEVDESYLLYTRPIVINDQLCLQCHGLVGKDITNENYAHMKSLYPEDKAIGYKLGDFRGIWSIKLSKKELIKAL